MSYDIEKALAYQIKKEIAQRYFRIRKLIEEDSANARTLLNKLEKIYTEKLKPAFLRIYSLLLDEDLIKEFSALLDLQEPPFLDEFLNMSQQEREKLIKDLEVHGWFKEKRFLNLLMDSYRMLYEQWKDYYDLREEVLDELELVKEEVKQFTKNYSLDDIMHFLRSLDMGDEAASKALGGTIEGRKLGQLDKKIPVVEDLEKLFERVPELARIPEPNSIESELKKVGEKAFLRHEGDLSKFL